MKAFLHLQEPRPCDPLRLRLKDVEKMYLSQKSICRKERFAGTSPKKKIYKMVVFKSQERACCSIETSWLSPSQPGVPAGTQRKKGPKGLLPAAIWSLVLRVLSCMKTPIPGGVGLHMWKIVIQSMRICSVRDGGIFLNQDKKYM